MEADDSTPLRFDAVVLGCGISGLVAASVLASKGLKRIALLDEFEHLGGNHLSRRIGAYTFDIGSFIFQDDSPLLEHFPEILDGYETVYPSWGKLTPSGKVVKYPIAIWEEVFARGPIELLRIAASVAISRLFSRRIGDARAFARFWIGQRLLRSSGLDYYLDRFLGMPAEEIDVLFCEKRMGWISEHAKLSFWLRRLRARRDVGPVNRQLVRPYDGFPDLYEPAKRRLESDGARFFLGSKLTRIVRDGDGLVLERAAGAPIAAARVVCTIPVRRAAELCGLDPLPKVASITMVSLYYSFQGERGFDQSILYNFTRDGAWKRLTMHSDFYGRRDNREFFCVEVNDPRSERTPAQASEDFRRHTNQSGLFAGDLRFEGADVVPFAYPIYTKNAREEVDRAVVRLIELGVVSFGRQGGFDYQPTARVSTLAARDALAHFPSGGNAASKDHAPPGAFMS